MKQSETVQFDVGGTLYKVSRSLLSQHSETMLAKMASTWQRGKDPDALFIERDGEQFRYVLSYMRDGRVSLPANGTVSKDALLMDLEYYGFVNIPATAITVSCMAVESVRYLFSLNESHKQRTEQHAQTIQAHQQRRLQLAQRHELEQRQLLEQQRAQMEAHDKHASSLEHYKLCMQFAFDLFKQYKESGNLQFSFATEMNVNPNNPNNPNNDDFYSMPHPTDNNTQQQQSSSLALQVLKGDKAPFNECLSQFGLECIESSGVQYSNDYSYSCVTLQLAILGDKQQQQQQQDGFADEAETTVSSSNNNNSMEPVVVSDAPNGATTGNHPYLSVNDASESHLHNNGVPAAAIPAAGIPTKETSGSDNSQSNRSITPPLYRRKLFQQPQQQAQQQAQQQVQQQQVQQMQTQQAQAQQQQHTMPLPDHSNSSNNSNTSSALGNNSNSNNEILGSGTPPGLYQRVRVSRRGSGGGGGFFRQSQQQQQQQAFAPSPMTLDGDVVDGIHNNQNNNNNNNNMNPAATQTMVLDPQQQQQQPPPQTTTTTHPPPASPQPPVTVVPSSAPLYQRVSKMLSVSSATACDNNNNGTGNPADAPPVVLEVNEVV